MHAYVYVCVCVFKYECNVLRIYERMFGKMCFNLLTSPSVGQNFINFTAKRFLQENKNLEAEKLEMLVALRL